MTGTRRQAILAGGGFLAGLVSFRGAGAAAHVAIRMAGTVNGSAVWFDPIGIRIAPGDTVVWTNDDRGNAHTATAYHRVNGQPLRLPAGAEPWDSGYLLPQQSFSVTLTVPGVYDFFCRPHHHAGMVGRIVVGAEGVGPRNEYDALAEELPSAALAAFPSVANILRAGVVHPPNV